MFKIINPNKADCEYAINTLTATYWYRQARIEGEKGNSARAKAYYNRGIFYDRAAFRNWHGDVASALYTNVYEQYRDSGFSFDTFDKLVNLLEKYHYPIRANW